jgi:hypothetical protein
VCYSSDRRRRKGAVKIALRVSDQAAAWNSPIPSSLELLLVACLLHAERVCRAWYIKMEIGTRDPYPYGFERPRPPPSCFAALLSMPVVPYILSAEINRAMEETISITFLRSQM